jgi:hypothetical protein
MQYLALIYGDEKLYTEATDEQSAAMLQAHGEFGAAAGKAGALLGGNGLESVTTATTVRVRDGDRLLTDGPFAETKEQLGGFFLVEAKDIDEACAVASRFPPARIGSIEVRPVQELEHS